MLIIATTALLSITLWAMVALVLAHRYPTGRRWIRVSAVAVPILVWGAYGTLFTQVSFSIDLRLPKESEREAVVEKIDILLGQINLQYLLQEADASEILSPGELKEMVSIPIIDIFGDVEGYACILVTSPVMLRSKADALQRVLVLLKKDAAARLKGATK
jgi:hypothetical protein